MTKHETMVETYQHKQKVAKLLSWIVSELNARSINHDNTKLVNPEVDIFTEYTPKLAGCTYGSDEYKQFLIDMRPALDHHYILNSHHPEYYANGISGMDLVDLVEMICDWKAATMRHADGDIDKSLEINQKRFGYSDELKQIFKNTVSRYL